MQMAQTGPEKRDAYSYEYMRLKRSLKEEFYLEAIFIEYAIIEDRLLSFLCHAGIVSRKNDKLVISKSVSPFVHRLLDKQISEPIQIKDISIKMKVIQKLLELDEEKAIAIDTEIKDIANSKKRLSFAQKGYLTALQKQIASKIDTATVLNILSKLDPWRDERNQLIHALLNKTVSSSAEARKECAEAGKDLSRQLDDKLVRPFRNNRIRKQFNIQ